MRNFECAVVILGAFLGIAGMMAGPSAVADGTSSPSIAAGPGFSAILPGTLNSAPAIVPLTIFGEQNEQFSGGAPTGLNMLIFGSTKAPSFSAQTPFTYGLMDNMTLLGGPKGAGAGGGLSVKGLFLASSDLAAGAPGQTRDGEQAIDQMLSYKTGFLAMSARMLNIGRGFSGSSGIGTALGGQSNNDEAKTIMGSAGQNEQNVSLALGTAKTGQLSLSTDQISNSLSNRNTGDTSLGLKWGTDHTMRFAFLDDTLVDRVAHTTTKAQSLTIGQTIARLLNLTFGHSITALSSGSSSTVDQMEMALSGKQAASVNMKGQMTHDSLGGYDRLFGVDAKRNLLGAMLSFHIGDESRRADGSSAGAYGINTIGYSADRQYKKILSFDTNWLETDDQSKTPGQQRSVVATSKLEYTPIANFSVQDLFTTSNGADNSVFDTSFSFPKDSSLAGTKLAAAVDQNTNPTAASTSMRKVTVDTTFAKIRNLLQLASVSDFHLEMDQTDTDAWGTNPGVNYDAAAIKIAGGLAEFKDSHWSYAYVERIQTSAGPDATLAPAPNSRAFDLTLPYRCVTLKLYDHDQLPQSDGTYQNIKEQHADLSTPLLRSIIGSATYTSTVDDSGAVLIHRRQYGVDFAGKPGLLPQVEFGLTRQIESEAGNGDEYGMIYKLAYSFLPPDTTKKVTVGCNVATNTFNNRTGAKDNVDATVHCDYSMNY